MGDAPQYGTDTVDRAHSQACAARSSGGADCESGCVCANRGRSGLPVLVQTTAYSTVENLPDLPAEEFSYEPLQNFTIIDHPPSLLATLSPGKPAPQPLGQPGSLLLYRRDPEYTPKALANRIQGVVTVTAMVGADGVPHEMRGILSLDPELDQKAIECVGAWRFRPGAPTPAMIDVRFR